MKEIGIKEAIEKGSYIDLRLNYNWVYAIENDDFTGLEEEEIQKVYDMKEKVIGLAKGKKHFISWVPADDVYFYHKPDFCDLACDVVDLKLIILEMEEGK